MESLKKSRDFRRAINGGYRKFLETIIIYRFPNQEGKTRIGISVTKKAAGGSVRRNLAKRRIREAVRRNAACIPGGEDAVIVARSGINEATYEQIEGDVRKAWGRTTGEGGH